MRYKLAIGIYLYHPTKYAPISPLIRILFLACFGLLAHPIPACAQGSAATSSAESFESISYAPLIPADQDEPSASTTSLDRKIHISAFAQGWLATGLGSRIGSSMPGGPLYPGRNYDMPGTYGARLRRAEAAADGNLSSRWFYHGMIDLANAFESGSNRQVLEDLYTGYRLAPELAIEAGRQNIGLGIEGSTDDNRLLTISRSIMSENLPVHVGRLGDIRSTGAMLRYTGKTVLGLIGIWNDPSSQRLGFDSARPPFADASVTYIGITRLSVSAFGGTHVLSTNGEVTDRVGGGLVWQRGPHLFQGEVEVARDYSAPTSQGGVVEPLR